MHGPWLVMIHEKLEVYVALTSKVRAAGRGATVSHTPHGYCGLRLEAINAKAIALFHQ